MFLARGEASLFFWLGKFTSLIFLFYLNFFSFLYFIILIFILCIVSQNFCTFLESLDLTFSLTEAFLSSILSPISEILCSISCIPLVSLPLTFLFLFLKFSYLVLPQFLFSLAIIFYFYILNCFLHFIPVFVCL